MGHSGGISGLFKPAELSEEFFTEVNPASQGTGVDGAVDGELGVWGGDMAEFGFGGEEGAFGPVAFEWDDEVGFHGLGFLFFGVRGLSGAAAFFQKAMTSQAAFFRARQFWSLVRYSDRVMKHLASKAISPPFSMLPAPMMPTRHSPSLVSQCRTA